MALSKYGTSRTSEESLTLYKEKYYSEHEENTVNDLVRNYNAKYEWSNGGHAGIIATLSSPQTKFLTLHFI